MFITINNDLLRVDTILRIVSSKKDTSFEIKVIFMGVNDYGDKETMTYSFDNEDDFCQTLSKIKISLVDAL